MRAAIGQVGFQVQDLVVQLQSGTPALTAFVQQGSQIAGAFGPVGAVIGTVGALLGVAAGALLGFNREAEASKPVLDAVVKSFNAAKVAAEGYGEALRGATAEQRNFATQAASVDVQSATAVGSDALGRLFDLQQGLVQTASGQQFLTPAGFLSQLRGPGPLAGTPIIGSERDLRGEVETAIAAGKADEVSRLLREAGLLTTPESLELAQAAVDAANRVAVAQGIASGEAVGGPRAAPPPGGMRTGTYGGTTPRGTTSGNPAVTLAAPTGGGSSVATLADQARREAEAVARAREEAAARLQAGQIAIYEAQAEETGRAYAAKWNESLAAEQQANGQAQADLLLEPARTAIQGIQREFTTVFQDIYSGQLKDASDYWQSFEDLATGTLANISATLVTSPLNNLLNGSSPLAQQTLGGAAPGLFGGTGAAAVSLGGIATAASLGAAGGGFLAGATGGNTIGGSVGGALGSGAGFVVGNILFPGVGGIPGAALGGLAGSLAGGLFGGGGGGERNNNFQYDIDLSSGRTSGSNTKPDQGNVDIVTQLTGRVQTLLDALQDLGGTTVGSINIQSGNNSGLTLDGRRYGNAEDLQLDAFRQIVLATTGLDPRVATAAGNSQATDAQEFISDLQFAENFDRLTRSTGDLASATEDLIKGFADATAKAEELGLSVEELAAAQDQQLRDQATSLQGGFRAQVESAFGYTDSLEGFLNQIRLGRGSGRQQLGTARSQFEDIAAAAQAGDLDAIGQLQGAASSYLSAAQNVYASGQGFQQVRQIVESVLKGVIGEGRRSERDLLEDLVEGSDNTVDALRENLTKVRDDLVAALAKIETKLGRALAT